MAPYLCSRPTFRCQGLDAGKRCVYGGTGLASDHQCFREDVECYKDDPIASVKRKSQRSLVVDSGPDGKCFFISWKNGHAALSANGKIWHTQTINDRPVRPQQSASSSFRATLMRNENMLSWIRILTFVVCLFVHHTFWPFLAAAHHRPIVIWMCFSLATPRFRRPPSPLGGSILAQMVAPALVGSSSLSEAPWCGTSVHNRFAPI